MVHCMQKHTCSACGENWQCYGHERRFCKQRPDEICKTCKNEGWSRTDKHLIYNGKIFQLLSKVGKILS